MAVLEDTNVEILPLLAQRAVFAGVLMAKSSFSSIKRLDCSLTFSDQHTSFVAIDPTLGFFHSIL